MTAISPCRMVVHGWSCGVNISGKWLGVSGGDVHGQIWAFQAQHILVPYSRLILLMYHYLLCPQPPTQHLSHPCHCHHPQEPSASSSKCSRKQPCLPAAASALQEEEPLPERHRTSAMPSMPCSAYHQYPFPSLLLIDLPALWRPSLPASCVITSRTTSHPYP